MKELKDLLCAPMYQIDMRNIDSLRLINGKVPTIELEHKVQANMHSRRTFFSMTSDYNMQETLMQLKRLKKEGNNMRAKQQFDTSRNKSQRSYLGTTTPHTRKSAAGKSSMTPKPQKTTGR